MNAGLKQSIEEAQCNLEEFNECGCLEERMEAAEIVAKLEQLLLEKERSNQEAKWSACCLCKGAGRFEEYGDSWLCGFCRGDGGSWT